MRGEAVTFIPQVPDAADEFGNLRMKDGDAFVIQDVMVAPSTAAAREDGRPHGSTSSVALYFDHDEPLELRGSVVEVRGKRYLVQGAPLPYSPGELNKRFGYEVEAVRVDG